MNMKEAVEEYKRIINKKYSKEECLEIMIPFEIHQKVMDSIVSLICDQPERSKREDLIEMVVCPEPDTLTKKRLEQNVEFFKNCSGLNQDLLGCGALNPVET